MLDSSADVTERSRPANPGEAAKQSLWKFLTSYDSGKAPIAPLINELRPDGPTGKVKTLAQFTAETRANKPVAFTPLPRQLIQRVSRG